uniref:Uncharacterized protein n=1 Tax=Nothobranchius rachovii TaxID=451742 RepID=A0A1A8S1W9_9TELE
MVDPCRFLGTTITQDLKLEPTITSIALQRMNFPRQLKKFNLSVQSMRQFNTAVIESILTSSITAGATIRDKMRLQRGVRSAEKVIGCQLPSIQDLCTSRTLRRAGWITADSSHPTTLSPYNTLQSIWTRTSRRKNHLFHSAVGLMNGNRRPAHSSCFVPVT